MSDEGGSPRLFLRLYAAHGRLRRVIAARGGESGLTAAGAGVLFHLAARGPSRMGDLADALGASPAGLSGLVDRLARRGLVERLPDPADGRAALVALTDAGAAEVGPALALVAELNAEATAGFTAEELAVVDRWLAVVAGLPNPRG